MRRDLIIGIIASALLHAGFIFGIPRPAPPKRANIEIEAIEITMPPLPPEEPDKPDKPPEEEEVEVTFVPPQLVDIPLIDANAVFVIPPTPPPPPDLTVSRSVTVPPTVPAGFGRGLGNIFNLSDLDQAPQPRVQHQPNYPYEMRRQGITGEVEVGFICDAEGGVRDAYVMRSSHREFEQSAIQAVSKWRFKPGRRAGKNVNVRMSVVIAFSFTS